jgi:hypothetical protein
MPRIYPAARLLTCLAIAATLAGPAIARKDKNAPVMTPAGKPQSCIQTSNIRETRVRDDQTIDFYMRGGRNKIYRNTLPYKCSGLGFEERFLYKSTTNQLCSVDVITVLHTGGGVQGPTCGLGDFQPVTETRRR